MEYQNTGIGQISKDEYRYYIQLCKDNLEAALANLNILMPATFDSIVALALGVSFAINIRSSWVTRLTNTGDPWN